MPNWCEGTIKFRGKREDIIRAMTEGLEGGIVFEEDYSTDEYLCFRSEGDYRSDNTFWIKDTQRHFVENIDSVLAYRFGEEFVIALHFRAAWGIIATTDADHNGLDNFAKEYHVDIRATGFMISDSLDYSYEYRLGFIVAINELTKSLLPKDDEKD